MKKRCLTLSLSFFLLFFIAALINMPFAQTENGADESVMKPSMASSECHHKGAAGLSCHDTCQCSYTYSMSPQIVVFSQLHQLSCRNYSESRCLSYSGKPEIPPPIHT